jgi:hypothetical protein
MRFFCVWNQSNQSQCASNDVSYDDAAYFVKQGTFVGEPQDAQWGKDTQPYDE